MSVIPHFKQPNDTLQNEAHRLYQQILKLNDVYTIETSGLLQREIYVDINPSKLYEYYMSLQEIVRSLLRRNINSSDGIININNSEKVIVTDAGYNYPLDITNTIIRSNFEKNAISIGDVAVASEGYENANNDVYINNAKAVFFGVRAKNEVDITKLTRELDDLLTSKESNLPESLQIVVVDKRSDSVNTILNLTQSSALMGIIIVFLMLLLFLDWRTAFWTTASIPITVCILLIALYYTNVSMNIITLCGIITALGMLVDHGIVISENIYRYREMGYPPNRAVQLGIQEVFMPVLVTVITTVVAFMPMLLIRDTIGSLIKPLPIVISLALIFSFVDSMFFLPAHLAHIPLSKPRNTAAFERFKTAYGSALTFVLKYRYLVVLMFLGLLVATLFVARHMFRGFVFMEPIGVSSIYVNLEGPSDINREQMKNLVNELTEVIKDTVPEHERTIIKEEIGKYHIIALSSKGYAPNKGQIAVYLSPLDERARDYDAILRSVEDAVMSSPLSTNFSRIFFDSFGLIPKTDSALNVRFLQGVGDDSKDYIDAMLEVYDFSQTVDGVVNPTHSTLDGNSKLVIEFDFIKMAQLGVDPSIVSETIRIAVAGFIPTMWRTTQDKIPYIVRLDESRNSIEELQELLIPNIANKLIPLKEFTSISEIPGGEDILRSAGQRMVEINIDVEPNQTTPTIVSRQIENFYNSISNRYPNVDFTTGGESRTISRAFEDFRLAFLIACMLIYIILLMLFREPLQPLIVLIAIPFGMIGAIWAFYFHNQVLSFMSLVGIVGLSGIVVNDAIVMVDFINRVVNESEDKNNIIPQVVEGAKNRIKAVILTTLTTIAGLMPSIYGLRGVADLIVPITTAIAYGLLFATILIPFFIPVLYMVITDMQSIRFPRKKIKNH